MMDKLTMNLRIILIGLSGLLTGCGIFSIDPPEFYYKEIYRNESDSSIYFIFENISLNDTLFINPNSSNVRNIFVAGDAGEAVIETVNGFSRYDVAIKLFTTEMKKEWTKPSGNFGDSINSPFNYDSWVYETLENDNTDAVGQITFTITEEDLK